MKDTEMIDKYVKFVKGLDILLEPQEIDVGTTPSEVIHEDGPMRLLHFIPIKTKLFPFPVLVVYALVNRYYILDLQPDKSVIRKLLDSGLDVYVIDWGYPSQADRYLTLDDYVNDFMDSAIDIVRKRSAIDKVTLIGVCQGGTFSVMYASLHQDKLKNLVTVVTPVDFDTDKGLLHVWAKKLDVDKIVDYYGNVPGDVLNASFLLTDPFRTLIDKYVGLFEQLHDASEDGRIHQENEEAVKFFLRMEKWIYDSPDQAGEAYRQFIKDLYQKNLLIKNELELDGKRIDLRKISIPMMMAMAKYDHLVPNEATIPLMNAVSSSDKDMVVFPTGHIGLFVGRKSHGEGWPKVIDWITARSVLNTQNEVEPGLEEKEERREPPKPAIASKTGSRSRKSSGSKRKS